MKVIVSLISSCLILTLASNEYILKIITCIDPVKTEFAVELCECRNNKFDTILNFVKPTSKMIVRNIDTRIFIFPRSNLSSTLFKTPQYDLWFLKALIANMKGMVPNFITNCSHFGIHEGRNLTIVKQFLGFLPTGDFLVRNFCYHWSADSLF